MRINWKYAEKLYFSLDAAVRKALKSQGLSPEDIKNNPKRFQHIIFPDGRQEYRWDGKRLVWMEPLKEPRRGVKIHWLK